MQTEKEYLTEKEKEAEFNRLFEMIIQYSPFGKWYQYMIGASNMLRKNLPKRIAVDQKDGRPYVQYMGDMSKFLAVWATPTHETIANELSHKNYWDALGSLLGGGQIKQFVKQEKKKGVTVFNISPDDIKTLWARKQIEDLKKPASTTSTASTSKNTESIKTKNPKLSKLQNWFRAH